MFQKTGLAQSDPGVNRDPGAGRDHLWTADQRVDWKDAPVEALSDVTVAGAAGAGARKGARAEAEVGAEVPGGGDIIEAGAGINGM